MINDQRVVAPDLSDVLEDNADAIAAGLRVSVPGKIVSYDSAKRTAVVLLGFSVTLTDGTVVKAPKVNDVLVVTLQGGGIHLGMPIKAGDECEVRFSDICLDDWFSQGGQPLPSDPRRHHISDAVCLVGLNSKANQMTTALTATEGGISGSQASGAKVAIDSVTGLLTVQNAAGNLAAILTALLTAIAADTNIQPATADAANTAKSALALVIY